MTTTVVDYRNALPARLIDDIVGRGYAVTDIVGSIVSVEHLKVNEKNAIRILEIEPSETPKRRLFGLIKGKPRRRIIATIWFNNYTRKASAKQWTVETKGAQHLEATNQLIGTISKKLGAKAKVILLDDQPQYEMSEDRYDEYS